MGKIIFSSEYFNVKDTLECGQLFRFERQKGGYLVFTCDKCAYVYNDFDTAVIECADGDEEYFQNYFDLKRDYSLIFNGAMTSEYDVLKTSATLGKGVRILNQDKIETLISFIVSQNNNIPRIKGILQKLCSNLGEKKTFAGIEYSAFPTVEIMASKPLEFYREIGLGYRAEYVKKIAEFIASGYNVEGLNNLSTEELKKELVSLKGVGPKVADCVLLFGFHRSDSFPVDTWIEKVYSQNFNGTLKDRKKIAEWFVKKFGVNSGYFQQYLFYYKRSLEKLPE